jgi:Kef-type K+ transport system membrane component KefB
MSSEKTVAIAQIGLSIIFIAGYFSVVILFLSGNIKTPPDWKDALTLLLGVITGSITTIVAFWFSRHRVNDKANQ